MLGSESNDLSLSVEESFSESSSSMFNVFSVGDGSVLQHDTQQMNKPSVKLHDIVSVTNSHASSQVLLLFRGPY